MCDVVVVVVVIAVAAAAVSFPTEVYSVQAALFMPTLVTTSTQRSGDVGSWLGVRV